MHVSDTDSSFFCTSRTRKQEVQQVHVLWANYNKQRIGHLSTVILIHLPTGTGSTNKSDCTRQDELSFCQAKSLVDLCGVSSDVTAGHNFVLKQCKNWAVFRALQWPMSRKQVGKLAGITEITDLHSCQPEVKSLTVAVSAQNYRLWFLKLEISLCFVFKW